MTPILGSACPTQPSSPLPFGFTEPWGFPAVPEPLIWASPHPPPLLSPEFSISSFCTRGGCHEFLQAAGARLGGNEIKRSATLDAPLPAPGQPHRDLSAAENRACLRLFAWLDGLVWLLLEGLGPNPCDRSPWALSLVFFPVGSFRWSQGTNSLLLRDMKRPFLRQKWLAEGVNPEVPVPEISLPSRSSQ